MIALRSNCESVISENISLKGGVQRHKILTTDFNLILLYFPITGEAPGPFLHLKVHPSLHKEMPEKTNVNTGIPRYDDLIIFCLFLKQTWKGIKSSTRSYLPNCSAY